MKSKLLKLVIPTLAAAVLLGFSSCSSFRNEGNDVFSELSVETEPVDVPLSIQWVGTFPVAELALFPQGQRDVGVGYIGGIQLFSSVWAAFKPGQTVPTVNFAKNVVVFVRNTQFFNRTSMVKATLTDEVLTVLTMETRSSNPIDDKVWMAMAVIPRDGMRAIQSGAVRLPVAMKSTNNQL